MEEVCCPGRTFEVYYYQGRGMSWKKVNVGLEVTGERGVTAGDIPTRILMSLKIETARRGERKRTEGFPPDYDEQPIRLSVILRHYR